MQHVLRALDYAVPAYFSPGVNVVMALFYFPNRNITKITEKQG